MSAEERDECENIILLCPTCHTLADKNPRQFPAETLYEWKRSHEHVIRRQFEVPVHESREKLASVVHKLLRLNRAIFLQYGPHSEHSKKPYSDAATVWQRRVLEDVLPRNRRIADLLRVNEHLLSEEEKEVVEKFVLHQQEFEFNHISGNKNSLAPLFPEEMNSILEE